MAAVAGSLLTGMRVPAKGRRPRLDANQCLPPNGEPWEDLREDIIPPRQKFRPGHGPRHRLPRLRRQRRLAEDIIVGLITKTNNNPFFVKMKEGAEAKAKELGVELRSFAGKFDGDNEAQVAAIESLISAGAKGILITPSDTKAIVPTIKKARDAGILVIALDTPLDPIDAADATFATDNFKAGELIGQWAAETLGDKAQGRQDRLPRPALRDQPTVDYLRDQGFMKGFGIDIKDPTDIRRRGRSAHRRPRRRPRAPRKAAARRWRTCCRRTPTSTSSTPSTSRPPPAPTRR